MEQGPKVDAGLIFDVGMNDGRDTAYYVSKGYRVVAIEADPMLAEQGRHRFSDDIAAGRVTVLNVGIADSESIATFWVNELNSEHSSFDKEAGGRDGAPCHPIEVPTCRLRRLFETYGVPYYIKIDIERYDRFCLEDFDPDDLPVYASIEAHSLSYLERLAELGYDRFKVIDQSAHGMPARRGTNETVVGRLHGFVWHQMNRVRRKVRGTGFGQSGPFGEETVGPWRAKEDVATDWLHFDRQERDQGTLNMRGWYDFHATRLGA
jgi:FkbM family methyltransferase